MKANKLVNISINIKKWGEKNKSKHNHILAEAFF